jgi:small subunit ribosomal protein S20
MPIKKSAFKALRQNVKHADRNQKVKSDIKALIRKIRLALAKKDEPKSKEWLKQTIKKIDKAVNKKVLKKNTGARLKARLAKAVSAIGKK